MFLLKHDTTRKLQIDKKFLQLEFEDNYQVKEYKVLVICNSAIHAQKSDNGKFPGLYYLISWKNLPEEENN